MRPVTKWNVGDTYDGGTSQVKNEYSPYQDAKPVLVQNLGRMCSYCEKAFNDERELHVEHIQAKSLPKYYDLKTDWNNFLLSCETCNGKDNKGNKDVIYGECHLPHLNNTFLSFQYLDGGVVIVNPNLTGKSKDNATALYELVRLDKTPMTSKPGDKRWKTRLEKWNTANKYLHKYETRTTDVDTIVDLVKGHGCWSIWFTVFKDHEEVRRALVEQIPGTARDCFDEHFNPVPRHPENTDDPI